MVSHAMQCVIIIGLQGSGKSAFCKDRFADTHVRINRDMLKTRPREFRLFELCLELEQACVIDNTNATIDERGRFIGAARRRGFRVEGYYLDVPVREALARNGSRPPAQRVPVPGVLATAKRMQLPTLGEGFDALHRVRLVDGGFEVTAFEPAAGE